MSDFSRFRVGDQTVVSGEVTLSRYYADEILVKVKPDANWGLVMTPYQARALARRLKAGADMLDPPKPRRLKGA